MGVTPGQYGFIQDVLSVFETSSRRSVASAGTITILADGAGYSAGAHQATDKSNAVDLICAQYASMPGAKFAEEFKAFLPELAANASTKENYRDPSPRARSFMDLWRKAAAEDSVNFIAAQDYVFSKNYWEPVQAILRQDEFQFALTALVLYDTSIQSGPAKITVHRQTFGAKSPKNGGDEKTWVRAYIKARADWISSFVSADADKQKLVRATVYRANALRDMVASENWDLRLDATIVLPRLRVKVPGAVG